MTQDEVLARLEPVEITPAYHLIGGKTHDTGHQVVRGTDSHHIYGVHTKKYHLLPHRDAISRVFDTLDHQKIEYTPSRLELPKGGGKMFCHLKFPDKIQISTGDEVNLELIVQNSYDGMVAFSMELGAWRIICSNGMVIGDSMFKIRQEHAKGFLREDRLVEEFFSQVKHFRDEVLPLLKGFREMGITKQQGLNLIQRLAVAEKWKKESAEKWLSEEERTGWGLYNVLTFVASHVVKSYVVQRNMQAVAYRAIANRN